MAVTGSRINSHKTYLVEMNRFDVESTANTSILWHVNGDFSSFNLCDQEISCLLQWIRLFWMWGRVPILKVELDVEIETKSLFLKKLSKKRPKAVPNLKSQRNFWKSYLENFNRRFEILKISTWAALASVLTQTSWNSWK